jgi:IclR family transcriptional regulator, acetate operon repressor
MPTRPAPPAPRRSGDVQSVARAARLLGCFADAEDALSLTELAKRTGLTTSTAHRLLGTLCHEGLLCRETGGERFLPGPLLLRLSRSSLLADDLGDIARHLDELVAETGESACFGVRRGDEVAILLAVSSPQALRVAVAAGARAGLATSALGHALLAFGEGGVERGGVPSALRVELLSAQFRGLAVVDDEDGAGVRGIAVPIRVGGAAHAALELRGPRERMRDLDGLQPVLERHAAAIASLRTAAAL